MSHVSPTELLSVDPPISERSVSRVSAISFQNNSVSTHSEVTLGLSTMLQSLTVLNARSTNDNDQLKIATPDLHDYIRIITKTLDFIGPTSRSNDPVYRTIVPPESCDAASLSRAAATLDITKIRMLLASSRISMTDINSYAQLILAEQDEYRRAHRRSLPIDDNAAGIYMPSEDESNRFVDDNPEVFTNFASDLRVEEYFHLLKAFTHESATEGKTSSKLLSMIGKYSLKLTTYRMCYMNGESYSLAKERVFKYLDEDKLYDQALSLNLPNFIILGPEHYSSDKEIVLQTLYAIFGLYYAVQGESGIIHLNKLVRWFDISA